MPYAVAVGNMPPFSLNAFPMSTAGRTRRIDQQGWGEFMKDLKNSTNVLKQKPYKRTN